MFRGLCCTVAVMRAVVGCVGASRSLHQRTVPCLSPRLAGDWTCACGFSNFASRAICFQCHRAKPIPPNAVNEPRVPAMDAQQNFFGKGDWMCMCGVHNFARRETCLSCEALRPVVNERRQQVARHRLLPGDWICEKCNAHNFRTRRECLKCGWRHIVNPTATTTSTATTAPSSKTNIDHSSGMKPSPWTCLTCHTANEQRATSCEVCGSVRTTMAVAAAGTSLSSTPEVATRSDDWHCSQCGFLNFSSRVRCKNCRTLSAAAGEATDSSLWICECGYKNFRDRESCRDCGVSKLTTQ